MSSNDEVNVLGVGVSERSIIFVVGAVQFVNILDFMMVMPLGPDFAKALDIPTSHLGYIGGSYTAAAAVSGIACAFFLDRFDRKRALGVVMLGLALGTLLGGFAQGLRSLLFARMVAGAFGGPASSLAMSIVADVIPSTRRGRAMGAVMGAFSAASVLGVPAGLELARRGGFRLPFYSVAGICIALLAFAMFTLPSMTGHLTRRREAPETRFRDLLARPTVVASYAMTASSMMAGFVLIPNISAHLQLNVGYPRESLGVLYLAGGAVSFFGMRGAGYLIDRAGSSTVATGAALMLAFVIWAGFYVPQPLAPLVLIFMGFMLANAVRNVAYNTLTSKVPAPDERARFGSLQSAVQHSAGAAGAFLSSELLTETADHHLVGMPRVALVSILLGLTVPLWMRVVERRVAREKSAVE